MNQQRPLWLILAPVMFLGLWSAGYAVAKVGLQYSEPMTLLTLRFGLVVTIMAAAFVVIRPPVPEKAMDWVHLAIVGFLIQSVYFGLCYIAFRAGDVSRVSALFFLVPPLAALLAWLLLGEIMPPVAWIGMMVAAVGVHLATRQKQAMDSQSMGDRA